jgi:photosystem I P700 chlorophyll a apoprotein A2
MSSFDPESDVAYSGVYNLLITIGFTNTFELYKLTIFFQLSALFSGCISLVHSVYIDSIIFYLLTRVELTETKLNNLPTRNIVHSPLRLILAVYDASNLRLNFHIGPLIGLTSILWSGHIIHKAIPVSRGIIQGNFDISLQTSLNQLYSGDFSSLACINDSDNHIWLSNLGAGSSLLTFNTGLKPDSNSLALSDISHHHLAIGVLLVVGSHLYSSLFSGYGHNISTLASANGNPNIIKLLYSSLNLNLALALMGLSFLSSLVAQHTYSLLPFAFMSYTTIVALYVHHQYIASIIMFGGLYHISIFLVRDYSINTKTLNSLTTTTNSSITDEPLYIVLKTKFQIISHLSWVSLFTGFHTLLIYVHNDTTVAFGDPDKQILLEPLIALNFQRISSNGVIGLGTGDLIVHHSFAFGIHTCVLILIKGSLDSRSSKIMPDKVYLSNSFACDGPTRGGTCDISSWDSAYLALFWVLNTDGWLMFYFHWKHLTLFENTVFQFDESSTYLNGWFKDYLWFNSASLINGYSPFRANDLSCWA